MYWLLLRLVPFRLLGLLAVVSVGAVLAAPAFGIDPTQLLLDWLGWNSWDWSQVLPW